MQSITNRESGRFRRYLVGVLYVCGLVAVVGCSGDSGNPIAPTLAGDPGSSVLPASIQPIAGGSGPDQVDVCHRAMGPNDYVLTTIAESALQSHISHGDAQPGEAVPDMPGFVFDASCSPVPGQGGTRLTGVLAGVGGVSGTVEVTLPVASLVAQSVTRRSTTVVTAAGTANLTGIGSVVLAGTWDEVTGALSLSGGGYSFVGTLSGGAVSGTFSGPGVTEGVFTALEVADGTVATYCGTYAGSASGVWNLAQNVAGRVLGAYSGTGGAGSVNGQRSGNSLRGRWGNNSEDGTYRGTISGNTVNGTWASRDGTGGGSFRGRTGNCR